VAGWHDHGHGGAVLVSLPTQAQARPADRLETARVLSGYSTPPIQYGSKTKSPAPRYDKVEWSGRYSDPPSVGNQLGRLCGGNNGSVLSCKEEECSGGDVDVTPTRHSSSVSGRRSCKGFFIDIGLQKLVDGR
jgi:hypothetical protein